MKQQQPRPSQSGLDVQGFVHYDPDAIASYYRHRPWQVIWRTIHVFWSFITFFLHLQWDKWQSQIEKNKLKRAAELREILTRLGPTFIKV